MEASSKPFQKLRLSGHRAFRCRASCLAMRSITGAPSCEIMAETGDAMPKVRLSARGIVRPIVRQASGSKSRERAMPRQLRSRGCARLFCRQRVCTSLAGALPPIRTLKVQVDQDHRAAPRALACAGVHLEPTATRGSRRRATFSAAKIATQRVFNWRTVAKALSPGQRCGTIVGRRIFFFFRMVDSSP